jgi:DNA-binding winged helix-turn-helix (wHTH) protein/tetratricopeptide (TPR) repeat protein
MHRPEVSPGGIRPAEGALELRLGAAAVFRPNGPELLIDGRPAKLGGRALGVLCTLVKNRGQLVTKRELMDEVWPDLYVEENNLQVQISTLRRLLGPGSILTVSGRGYRLVLIDHYHEASTLDGTGAGDPSEATARRSDIIRALSVPLLERKDAFLALENALASTRQGVGATCLVFGEAGIGKSSLCDAFLSRLEGVRVLRGGCEALLSPRPLGPLYDFAGQLDEPARRAIREADARSVLFPTVYECLQDRPTVLLLEDLHWSDEATLDFVKYLGRRVAGVPVLLILTYRDDELTEAHPLRQVVGDLQRSVIRIPLQPLSEDALAEMARQAGKPCDDVLRATGGNPFYVTEVLEADGMPATVVDAVCARFFRQATPIRNLMEMVSTLPGHVEHWIVDELMDPEGEALQEALSCGLILANDEGIRFRHEIARRAIEQSMSVPKLRRLHSRLLDFLSSPAGRTVASARLVHHAKAAGRTADVLLHGPVAARDASVRGAHREAAALYASVLEFCESLPLQARAHMLEACAWENMVSDKVTVATQRYEEALALWRSLGSVVDQGRVMVRLARSYWTRCRGQDCERMAVEAVALLESEPERPEYLDALVETTRVGMLHGRNSVVFSVGAKALQLARNQSNERLVAHLLNNIGTCHCQAGHLKVGIEMLEQSLDIGRRICDEDVIGRYYSNLPYQLVEHRRYDEADRRFAECERTFPLGGESEWYYWQGMGWQAHAQIARGRWNEASVNAKRALSHYRSSSTLPFSIHALLSLARLAILRGEPGAEEPLREATQLAESMREPQRLGPAAVIRCEQVWLAGGSLEPMVEKMTGLLAWFRELGRQAYVDELGYWLWRCGLEPRGVDSISPRGLQMAGRWREAAAAWRSIGCPLEEAQALLEGDGLAIDEAALIFERLGAIPYVAKCADRARTAAATRSVRSATPSKDS